MRVESLNEDCPWPSSYVYIITFPFKSPFIHVVKIKIVHAAWLRDNTWPLGAVAPEPDDILLDGEPSSEPKSYPPLFMSGTEPCLAVNLDE